MAPAGENWELWHQTRTLDDLAELTGQWLDGDLPTSFIYRGAPDVETADIPGDILVELNRSGFLTYASQPGHDWTRGHDGALWRQRAHVGFLLDDYQMADVAAAVRGGGSLVVLVRRARWARLSNLRNRFAWSLTERRPAADRWQPAHTTCTTGHAIPRSYWRAVGRTYNNPTMGRVLAGAWQVDVFDLEWGCNDVLWETLESLLIPPVLVPPPADFDWDNPYLHYTAEQRRAFERERDRETRS
jgi:hypothetical protein